MSSMPVVHKRGLCQNIAICLPCVFCRSARAARGRDGGASGTSRSLIRRLYGRCALDWLPTKHFGAADSGSVLTAGSLLSRRSCFLEQTKTVALASAPAPQGFHPPIPWCGHAPKGHPWPSGARSASMPSDPHHDTSTQPPDARLVVFMKSRHKKQKQICDADFYLNYRIT